MDPALPPGGLTRIFQQFDAIRSHGDPPPWEPEDEKKGTVSNTPTPKGTVSNPPTPEVGLPDRAAQGVTNPTPPEAGKSDVPTPEGVLSKNNTPLRTKEKVDLPPSEGLLRNGNNPSKTKEKVDLPPPKGVLSKNNTPLRTEERVDLPRSTKEGGGTSSVEEKQVDWGAVRAAKEERAQQLLEANLRKSREHTDKQNQTIEERLHEAQERKVYDTRLKNPHGATFAQDETGMDAAYAYKSFPGAAYDENTQTLYVAGSDSWRSWYDDFRNIPAWGDLKDSERYKQAERAYDDLTTKYGKHVRRVVGHSLGGSAALELAKNKGIEYSRTFGAPVLDVNPFHRGQADRYRHPLDPACVLDRGASWGSLAANPHSYGRFKEVYDEPAPYIFDVGQKAKPQQQTLRS